VRSLVDGLEVDGSEETLLS